MNIGDVFLRMIADDTGFAADVTKKATAAGDKAGMSMGKRIGAGLKGGFQVAAGGASLFFTAAAKGALELENVAADFQAQTGATADEAARAAKDINQIAGAQRQSLETVSAVAVRVRRDLGVTGDAAKTLTSDFVEFARVTKTDAAGAVANFDDILDSWNLKATDSKAIMDKLLVSQQKFGGSIEESEQALAKLAPSLQAANFSLDDAIGFLNLFQASGVDASKSSIAFNAALKKVKSPAELKNLIRDIQNTADPFLRSQKAATLFGAKAGRQLANALKPSDQAIKDFHDVMVQLGPQFKKFHVSSQDGARLLDIFTKRGIGAHHAVGLVAKALQQKLSPKELEAITEKIEHAKTRTDKLRIATKLFGQDYGTDFVDALAKGHEQLGKTDTAIDKYVVSTDEATGATDKARDAIDSTFSAKAQKLVSELGAKVREFGKDLGPGITGLASIGTLISAAFGPGVLTKVVGSLGKLAAGIGTKLIALLVPEMAAAGAAAAGAEVASQAAGTAAGQAAVGAATAAPAAVAGTAVGTEMGAAAATAEVTTETAGVVAGQAEVAVAAGPAAAAAGTSLGSLMALAMKAAIVLGVAAIADAIHQPLADLGATIHDSLPDVLKAPGDWFRKQFGGPNDWPWPLGNKDAPDWARFSSEAADGAKVLASSITGPIDAAGHQVRSDVIATADGVVKAITGIPDRTAQFSTALTKQGDAGARGIEAPIAAASEHAAKDILDIPVKTASLPGHIGGQGASAASALAAPFPAAIASVVAGLLGIPTRTSGVPAAIGAQGVSAAAGFRNPFPGAIGSVVAGITGIPARTANVDNQITAQGDAGARGFKGAFNGIGGAVAGKFGGIPGEIRQKLTNALIKLAQSLASLFTRNFTAHANVTVGGGGRGPVRRQGGGIVEPGQLYTVNEERGGPTEFFMPSVRGRIIPSMGHIQAAAVGNTQYNISVPIQGLVEARTPNDIIRPLRQLAQVGYLSTPKRLTTKVR